MLYETDGNTRTVNSSLYKGKWGQQYKGKWGATSKVAPRLTSPSNIAQ